MRLRNRWQLGLALIIFVSVLSRFIMWPIDWRAIGAVAIIGSAVIFYMLSQNVTRHSIVDQAMRRAGVRATELPLEMLEFGLIGIHGRHTAGLYSS